MSITGSGYVNLISSMGNDLTIVNAARKSFNKKSSVFTEKDKKLLKYLWGHKHTTPFEFVEFVFEVKAPLFVVRQWQRHRMWSFVEASKRYSSEGIDFFNPVLLRKQSTSNKQASDGYVDPQINNKAKKLIDEMTSLAYSRYNELLDCGVAREQARMVLTQNMMTEFVGKVDLHNLLHFLKLRTDIHAQEEMRDYAKEIEYLITPIVPETMALYKGSKNV